MPPKSHPDTSPKNKTEPKLVQIHLRVPADVVALIDKKALQMQDAVQKVMPGAEVSRAEAALAIITHAVTG